MSRMFYLGGRAVSRISLYTQILIIMDGFIFLTGHTLSGTKNWDTYTIKINLQGDVVWESKKGNPRGFNPKYIHDEAWDVKATTDGGCIVVAGTGDEYGNYNRKCGNDGDNSNTWHVYLIRYNSLNALIRPLEHEQND